MILCMQGDAIEAGDLLVRMEEGDEPLNPMKSLDPGDEELEVEPFKVPS